MKHYLYLLIFVSLINNNFAFGQDEKNIQSKNSNVERVYKTNVLKEIGTAYLSEVKLFRPTLFVFDSDLNKLFVYDFGHKNLYSIHLDSLKESSEVLKLSEIGNGVGSGPKEFRNPTDICITDDKVIVIDPDLARVTIWDVNSETLLSSFRPKKFVPFRLACNNEKIVLYNANPSNEDELVIYDHKGTLISYLKEEDQSEKGPEMRMESGYLSMNETEVVFARTDVELVKTYDHKQMELDSKELFVSTNFNETKTEINSGKEQVVYKRSDDFLYRSKGVGLYKNYVIMLYSGRKDAYGKILDFYKIDDLSYVFSVQIEEFANTLHINGDVVVLRIYDTNRKENILSFYKLFGL